MGRIDGLDLAFGAVHLLHFILPFDHVHFTLASVSYFSSLVILLFGCFLA
jgi:hypothetical protein